MNATMKPTEANLQQLARVWAIGVHDDAREADDCYLEADDEDLEATCRWMCY